jgi:hypothetical protein
MQTWSEIADFYRAVSQRPGWVHLAPMVSLVEWLERDESVTGLHAFTSHEQLCLTSTADRNDYLRLPFVTIVSTPEGEYLVTFSARPTSRVRMKRFIPPANAQREIPPVVSLLRRTSGDV